MTALGSFMPGCPRGVRRPALEFEAQGPYYAETGMSYIAMPMTLTRRLYRYFALALATAHLVVFAAAPVVEGRLARLDVGIGVAVGDATPERSVPAHDPSTCIACQIISSIAALPQPATILLPTDDAGPRDRLPVDGARQVFQRQGFLSRAPPTLPA